MLNRRFLRIKVMQALYGFFQEDNGDLKKAEKTLMLSLDNIYSLYLYLLALLIDTHQHANSVIEDAKNKKLPSQSDLNPNTRFIENKFLSALVNKKEIKEAIAKRKISWEDNSEIVRKIFADIKVSEEYKSYMLEKSTTILEDKEFISNLLVNIIAEHEFLTYHLEEKNIHWADDLFVGTIGIKKTIDSFNGERLNLQELYKAEADDVVFVTELFEKCIIHNDTFSEMISEKTVNWEVDRIAQMDVLLMKMALSEVLYFPNIPIKVTLNEYIDISKEYSTPKSKMFINGILDKIVLDLNSKQKITKTGRGLQEN